MTKRKNKYKPWGYVEVLQKDHPFVRPNGCVFEHRLVAEKKLGRFLKPEEEVHHIDEIKNNNSPNNLVVFATKGDHARFHKTGVMLPNPDGTYYSPKFDEVKRCENCNKNFTITMKSQSRFKFCSVKCFNLKDRKVANRPSKEELYTLLSSNTFTAIGEMYGVSCNAIRKWCKLYGIPHKASYYKEVQS